MFGIRPQGQRQYRGHESLIKGALAVSGLFTHLGRAVAAAVYPPVCYACGRFLDPDPEPVAPAGDAGSDPAPPAFAGLMARFLCPDCAAAFTPIAAPFCPACGVMFPSRETTSHRCGLCRREPKSFAVARATGLYDQSLMALLRRLKYHGRVELAGPLGCLLGLSFFKWFDPAAVDLIMPVPLHPSKQRQRGFNQTWLMMRAWRGQIPAPAGPVFCHDLLVRTRATRSQTSLTRPARRANVRGAFGLTDPARVEGRSVLLVDDVYTTGATVDECARALITAGAARVDVLTVARVK